MAYTVMADIVMACAVMAYTVMAYIFMACTVMAYTVMAYIVMAGGVPEEFPLRSSERAPQHSARARNDLF